MRRIFLVSGILSLSSLLLSEAEAVQDLGRPFPAA